MGRRFRGAVVFGILAYPLVVPVTGVAADADDAPGQKLFGPARVWAVHLEIPAAEFAAMQPAAGGFGFPGAPGAPPQPNARREKRDGERNLFGTEFLWVRASFSADGKVHGQVGLR